MVEGQMMKLFQKAYDANNSGLKEISVNTLSDSDNTEIENEIVLKLFQIATKVGHSEYIRVEITRVNQIPSFHLSWEKFPECYSDLKNEFDRYSDLLLEGYRYGFL
jgi:hypothetical protein